MSVSNIDKFRKWIEKQKGRHDLMGDFAKIFLSNDRLRGVPTISSVDRILRESGASDIDLRVRDLAWREYSGCTHAESVYLQVPMEVTSEKIRVLDGCVEFWGYVGDYEVMICRPLTDPYARAWLQQQIGAESDLDEMLNTLGHDQAEAGR